jgi:P63C domain.
MERITLNSTFSGELHIGDITIPCYVLKDGRRVLSGRGMQSALDLGQTRGQKIDRLVNNLSIKPLINKDVALGILKPIEFRVGGGVKAFGYEATSLVEICDVLLQAKKDGILPERYISAANRAEILIRSFAKIGIVALIDEATGYQYNREKYELQKILKAYISEELLPWQKRFPDIFYKELFRLNGWDFTPNNIKKRPGVIGTWTNKLIYEQLPNGVLEELKSKTPTSASGNKTVRYHQLLTLDVGEPNLNTQIGQIVTLFQLSDNMEHMWNQFNKLKSRQQGQLELPFSFDENGHTKELKNTECNPKDKD